MGAFLSGLFKEVGPRLEEKHQQELDLQKQKKQGEFNTYWGSMQTAATRLAQLKAKGQLTPEEEAEATKLSQQYAWSDQQLTKLTKGSKPLAEGVAKLGGVLKQILTHPSPKGKLQAPGGGIANPQAPGGTSGFAGPVQSLGKGNTDDPGAAGQPPVQATPQAQPAQPRQPLQPPAPISQPSGSMQGAMALAGDQSDVMQKSQIAEMDRKRRRAEGERLNLQGRDLAEYEETGKVPSAGTQPRSQVVKGTIRPGDEYKDKTFTQIIHPDGATDWIEEAPKAQKKVNLQAGWVHIPGDPDGKLTAVRIDPQNPGKVFNANTGAPVPEGAEQVNPSTITAQMRQDSYGAFGNYYRAARGRGMGEDAARQEAGNKIEKEYNVRLGRQEQQIAIDAAVSGIGGGGSAAPSPPPTPPVPSAPKGATPKTQAATEQPHGLTPTEQQNINVYLGDLLGTMKVPAKGAARKMAGMNALAKATGLSPMQLNAELATDKATAKALAQAVEVAGAFGRIQETLKAHGQVLLKAATDYGPGNVPLKNRTVQWVQRNAEAHPELTRYVLALQAVQREYGRLIAGGVQSRAMLPVSSTEKGEATLRADATMADIAAAVSQLQIEADTEQKAFGNQIEGLKSKLTSGKVGQAASGATPSPNGMQRAPGSDPSKMSNDELFDVLSGKK